MKRYAHLGRIYDLISLEPLLYRGPRQRLGELLGPIPGATVVDVGCGTGLNLGWLHEAVSPGGRVVGVDASESMLAAARRRIRRHDWSGVEVVLGDVVEPDKLADALSSAGATPDAFVATFVLSLLGDDGGFWTTLDRAANSRLVHVAIADLGAATDGPRPVRAVLDAMAALGGGRRTREPWRQLARRDSATVHETSRLGHVHLACGTCGAPNSA